MLQMKNKYGKVRTYANTVRNTISLLEILDNETSSHTDVLSRMACHVGVGSQTYNMGIPAQRGPRGFSTSARLSTIIVAVQSGWSCPPHLNRNRPHHLCLESNNQPASSRRRQPTGVLRAEAIDKQRQGTELQRIKQEHYFFSRLFEDPSPPQPSTHVISTYLLTDMLDPRTLLLFCYFQRSS